MEKIKGIIEQFYKKHEVSSKYDLNEDYFLKCCEELNITEDNDKQLMLMDLFYYGFAQGYKQKDSEAKAKQKAADNKLSYYQYKLLNLIRTMPAHSEDAFSYLYSFIAFGMDKGKFPYSKKYKAEIEAFVTYYNNSKEDK